MSIGKIADSDRYLLVVLGGPRSGKDRFIEQLVAEDRLGTHYDVIGPDLAETLPGIAEARKKTVVHPEKLPEMIVAYDQLVRSAAITSMQHGKSVVFNGHGDDIERIMDIIEHVPKGHHVIVVGVIMPPEDLFQQIQDKVAEGKLSPEDSPRILDLHKNFRTNLTAFAHMADITLVFNRERDKAPELSTLYEAGTQDIFRTVLDEKSHRQFRRWQHVNVQAATLNALIAQEPELRSTTRNAVPDSYTQAHEQQQHRNFAEKLLGVPMQKSRGRA